jgi:hypothetical protein
MNTFEAWMKNHAQIALLVLIMGAVAVIDMRQSDVQMGFINLFAAGLVYMKMSIANLQVEAHGVSGLKRHRKFLGIPWPITLLYGFLMAIIVSLGMVANGSGLMPQTVLNLHLLAASAFCGWFGGVAHWYYYAYHATYYVDEYAERARMKASGWSPEQIEDAIAGERTRGLLGPKEL